MKHKPKTKPADLEQLTAELMGNCERLQAKIKEDQNR